MFDSWAKRGQKGSIIIISVCTLLMGAPRIQAQCTFEWKPGDASSGLNGEVRACVGRWQWPSLYVGGAFTSAGGVSANKIAKWNGTSWSAMGSGTGRGVYEPDRGGHFHHSRGDNGELHRPMERQHLVRHREWV